MATIQDIFNRLRGKNYLPIHYNVCNAQYLYLNGSIVYIATIQLKNT